MPFLRRTLPAHMVPAEILFMDSLPLTANSKVDRTALETIDAGDGVPLLARRILSDLRNGETAWARDWR